MNIYELLNRFWLENEYDPCSTTEIALYFFLLNKAIQDGGRCRLGAQRS